MGPPEYRITDEKSCRRRMGVITNEIGLDLVNFLDIKNILTLTYSPDSSDGEPIREEYQLGFLPLFYYKIDF